jgi:hypothetical protein
VDSEGPDEWLVRRRSARTDPQSLGSKGWEFAFLTPERLVFKREILKISPEELWELGQVQVVDEE